MLSGKNIVDCALLPMIADATSMVMVLQRGGDLRPNSFGNYLGRFVAEWIRRGWSTYGALLTGVQDGAWKLYQIRYYSPWSALYHGR